MKRFTPLHFLFHTAFLKGETKVGDRGSSSISIAPKPGESIFVFKTDDDEFAGYFDIRPNEPRSDAMLLYVKESEGKLTTLRLAFIELKKKSKHGHAVDQLDRVVRAVQAKLRPLLGTLLDPKNLRAVIVHEGSAPPNLAMRQKDFTRQHKFPLAACHAGDENGLRKHLI